jgi:hypothetical protein
MPLDLYFVKMFWPIRGFTYFVKWDDFFWSISFVILAYALLHLFMTIIWFFFGG